MKLYSPISFWLILCLSPLPFLYCLFYFITHMQKLDQIEEEMQRIYTKARRIEEVEQKEGVVLSALKSADPHYLDKHIETLSFLLPEIKKLETIRFENPDEEQVIKRLQFLKEGGNRLVFSEEKIRSHEFLRETEEKQQHSIEVNEEDLKKLLCLIEGVTIWPYGPKEGRPGLIITDFKLSKKEMAHQEKVFVVNLEILKRETVDTLK